MTYQLYDLTLGSDLAVLGRDTGVREELQPLSPCCQITFVGVLPCTGDNLV